jgi:dephospho-CoA kinase
MTKIGLTGGLGTGKTTVLKYFKKLGAQILSCDELVHVELKSNKTLRQKIRKFFGPDVFYKKEVRRPALAKRVFSSKKELNRLSALIHPLVRKRLRAFFRRCSKNAVIVVEVPLLFEAGFDDLFDVTIGVATGPQIQRERLRQKCRLRTNDIARRMRWQLSLDRKIARCDFVIDNNGSKRKTFNQVKQLMEEKQWKN